jgi:hypothetical protein
VYKISHSWLDVLIFLCPFIWSRVSGKRLFLTADQKQQCVDLYEKLCQITSNDATFLSRVISGEDSWIYGYDPDTKQQATQWKMKSKVKCLLIFFFDNNGIVHKEFVLAGQTVNSAYYCDILRQLSENM